ncbi:TPA: hypothetical protein ACOQZT_000405 [Serratia odorifera]
MPTPISMAGYHDTVIRALRDIPWVRDADSYPEKATALKTPAVYLSVPGWERGDGSNGQLNVTLDCELFVVVNRSATVDIDKPAIYAATAAADISQWIEGKTFGIDGLSPAELLSSSVDNFDQALDDYIVWLVKFSQGAAMGIDPFASTGTPLKEVYLGRSPDIGAAHVNDYHLIYKASENGTGTE